MGVGKRHLHFTTSTYEDSLQEAASDLKDCHFFGDISPELISCATGWDKIYKM